MPLAQLAAACEDLATPPRQFLQVLHQGASFRQGGVLTRISSRAWRFAWYVSLLIGR